MRVALNSGATFDGPLKPVHDLSPAQWLVPLVPGFGRVQDVVPANYDSYARLPREAPLHDYTRRDSEVLGLIVPVMSLHTSTPGSSWYALWEGWPVPSAWRHSPTFRAHGNRVHLLFAGAVDDLEYVAIEFCCAAMKGNADACRRMGNCYNPSLWWPDAREWVYGCDEDTDSAYVAGPEALIDALVGMEGLGATRCRPDDEITEA